MNKFENNNVSKILDKVNTIKNVKTVLLITINPLFCDFFYEIANKLEKNKIRCIFLLDHRILENFTKKITAKFETYFLHPVFEDDNIKQLMKIVEKLLNIDFDLIISLSSNGSLERLIIDNLSKSKFLMVHPHQGDYWAGSSHKKYLISLPKDTLHEFYMLMINKILRIIFSIVYFFSFRKIKKYEVFQKFYEYYKKKFNQFNSSSQYRNEIFFICCLAGIYKYKVKKSFTLGESLFIGSHPDILFAFSKFDALFYKNKLIETTNKNVEIYHLWDERQCITLKENIKNDIVFLMPAIEPSHSWEKKLMKSVKKIIAEVNFSGNFFIKPYPFYTNGDREKEKRVYEYYFKYFVKFKPKIINEFPKKNCVFVTGNNTSVVRDVIYNGPIINLLGFPVEQYPDNLGSLPGTYYINEQAGITKIALSNETNYKHF